MRLVIGFVFIVVVVGVILQQYHDAHNDNTALTTAGTPQHLSEADYSARIDPSVYMAYTREGFPKTFAKLGERMDAVQRYREAAAKMVLDSGKCQKVQLSELSTKSTPEHLLFFIDCANHERVYLDEFDIDQHGTVLTQNERAWNEQDALSSCEDSIRRSAKFPSKVDIHAFTGTSIYKAPTTGNVVVTVEFDAMNGFGNQLPYTAKCYYAPGEDGKIEITVR